MDRHRIGRRGIDRCKQSKSIESGLLLANMHEHSATSHRKSLLPVEALLND